MQKITPFLWFDEQAQEAATFYTSIFKNGKMGTIRHFPDFVPGPKGKVLTVSFELAGLEITGLNGGPEFGFTPAVSFFVNCQTEAEIDTLWKKLSKGGEVLMELNQYPFSEKFGWVNDRFGVSWQMTLSHLPQKINPFIMFVGEQHGKAEEAINFYVSLFKDSCINHLERFTNEGGELEGAVKHANFTLAGQEFMAMDGGREHAFNFTEATSFVIHCDTQAEIDYFWEKLTDGGEEIQCGWLKDRYGLSWQVVPTLLDKMETDPNEEKSRRVMQAVLNMVKLDINELNRVYEQG